MRSRLTMMSLLCKCVCVVCQLALKEEAESLAHGSCPSCSLSPEEVGKASERAKAPEAHGLYTDQTGSCCIN